MCSVENWVAEEELQAFMNVWSQIQDPQKNKPLIH